MTIDLSTNPEGPYVTERDKLALSFVGRLASSQPEGAEYVYSLPDGRLISVNYQGFEYASGGDDYDLIPAPVEPEKRYLLLRASDGVVMHTKRRPPAPWGTASAVYAVEYRDNLPIDGSTIRRVEP